MAQLEEVLLDESVKKVVSVLLSCIVFLLGALWWAVRRLLAKMEERIEATEELAVSTEHRLTILETEHKIRHKGE